MGHPGPSTGQHLHMNYILASTQLVFGCLSCFSHLYQFRRTVIRYYKIRIVWLYKSTATYYLIVLGAISLNSESQGQHQGIGRGPRGRIRSLPLLVSVAEGISGLVDDVTPISALKATFLLFFFVCHCSCVSYKATRNWI